MVRLKRRASSTAIQALCSLSILSLAVLCMCLACRITDPFNRDFRPFPMVTDQSVSLPSMKAVTTEAINPFGLELYLKMQRDGQNLCLSPLSVFITFAVVGEGAQGKTKTQILETLKVDKMDMDLPTTLGSLGSALYSSVLDKGGTISIANAFWVHRGKDFTLRPDFVERTAKRCGLVIRESDFFNTPDRVAGEINAWVDKATNGKITNVASARDILQDSEKAPGSTEPGFVLVNAVYFKSDWIWKFQKRQTVSDKFVLLDGSTSECMMMNQTSSFRYLEEPDFQALEMPYKGDEVSMVVFLPKKMDGLLEFEKTLTWEKMNEWLKRLAPASEGVAVSFPKYTMGFEFDIRSTLGSMGIVDAFSEGQADFRGMLEKTQQEKERLVNLYLGKAWRSSWIQVDEEGTTAVAATSVWGYKFTGVKPQPIPFRADHPCLYLLRHVPTGCILFIGRVTKPKG